MGATDDTLILAPRQPCDALSLANFETYSAMLDGHAVAALRSEMTGLKDADNSAIPKSVFIWTSQVFTDGLAFSAHLIMSMVCFCRLWRQTAFLCLI